MADKKKKCVNNNSNKVLATVKEVEQGQDVYSADHFKLSFKCNCLKIKVIIQHNDPTIE